jgi:hypothetical protein
MQTNELIVIIDTVEDDEWDNKAFKKILTMSGETYKLGRHLIPKYNLLSHGVALRLIMDKHDGREYVKDYDACINLVAETIKELSEPAPKNPRDISIERQTAVKCVCDILAGGQPVPDDLKEMTFEWIRGALK